MCCRPFAAANTPQTPSSLTSSGLRTSATTPSAPQAILGTDFGYYKVMFPQPQIQLANYHKSPYNFKMGCIRKPRLGNTASISYAMSQGWIRLGELRDGEFDETLVPKPELVPDATRGRLSS